MKTCTCKQILKTSKQKLLPRMPRGTYKTPNTIAYSKAHQKNKRKYNERKPYFKQYYKQNALKMKKYQRKWWKRYGKQYSNDTKEHQKVIHCLWLIRTGRIKWE